MKTNEIESNIMYGINEVISEFQSNPYTYLFESDIQCAVFSALRKRLPLSIQIPAKKNDRQAYEVRLVYSEYKSKIDIVCLDSEAISHKNITDFHQYNGNDTYIYNLPLLAGIELKYSSMGYFKGYDILQKDFKKLSTIDEIKNRLAICFFQTEEQALPLFEDMKKRTAVKSMAKIEKIYGRYAVSPSEIYYSNEQE